MVTTDKTVANMIQWLKEKDKKLKVAGNVAEIRRNLLTKEMQSPSMLEGKLQQKSILQ